MVNGYTTNKLNLRWSGRSAVPSTSVFCWKVSQMKDGLRYLVNLKFVSSSNWFKWQYYQDQWKKKFPSWTRFPAVGVAATCPRALRDAPSILLSTKKKRCNKRKQGVSGLCWNPSDIWHRGKCIRHRSRRSSYVDELVVVTLFQIVQDRRIVEVCQVGHVLSLLILGRVHLLEQVFLHVPDLHYAGREKKGHVSLVLVFGHLRRSVLRSNAA